MRTLSLIVLVAGVALVGGVTLLVGCGGPDSAGPGGVKPADRISGSGSSFVAPLMTKTWAPAYKKARDLEVDYVSTGSSTGITQMIDKKNDFGCTDAPMNEEQLKNAAKNGGDVLHIPLTMGAVVPIYNLPDLDKPINFTGPVLADIFLGKIKKWNDPALQQANQGVKLPGLDISVGVRADGSGTTYIWTDYLSKVSPEWMSKVGAEQLPNWPVAKDKSPKNDGVAGFVSKTHGAIGYVELAYAEGKKDLKIGAVQNKAGKYVMASLQSTIAAGEGLKEADIPDDLIFSMTDAEGADAYPICGAVWAVMYVKQPKDKAAALKEFLTWALHDGQGLTKERDYASLSKALTERAQKKVDTIKGE
jgi:phosphate transport system substrate-binding protein